MVNRLKALYSRDRNHPCIVRSSISSGAETFPALIQFNSENDL